jgi:hypothetical protein
MFPLEEPAALVIAHPGHEARLRGWVERARPRVFVVTDGSGRGGVSRIGETARALKETGALSDYLKLMRGGDAANDANDMNDAAVSSGLDLFRVECLRPVNGRANGASSSSLMSSSSSSAAKPFYELHSERQVVAGHYERVIHYREHLLPLANALCEHVGRRAG